jgi:hypothetical protein
MSDETPLSFVKNRRLREHPTELGSVAFTRESDGREDSLSAMRTHTTEQLERLQEQADLLVQQAKAIEERMQLAERISQARYNFRPVFLQSYYLYEDPEGQATLTLIAPEEWGSTSPYGEFQATVRQLGDSTWELVEDTLEDEGDELQDASEANV